MENDGTNRVRSLVGGQAHLLLGDLLKARDIPRSEASCCSEGGWCVLVAAYSGPGRRGR